MIKGPLAFLELLLLTNVFKVLLTLERRVVYASHEHIQANNATNKKQYTKQYKQYITRV